MVARIYETPLKSMVERMERKKEQLEIEYHREPVDWHSLNHIANDLAAVIHGINERIKRKT